MNNILIEGDPMNPSDTDLIAQQDRLPVGQPVPGGWRVLTGNSTESLIARVAYRYEIDHAQAAEENCGCSFDGCLHDRYAIYIANTDEQFPKTFDEWLGA